MRARSTSAAAHSRIAGTSPTNGTLRVALAGSTGDPVVDVVVVVVIGVILPSPRRSLADPSDHAGYTTRRDSPRDSAGAEHVDEGRDR